MHMYIRGRQRVWCQSQKILAGPTAARQQLLCLTRPDKGLLVQDLATRPHPMRRGTVHNAQTTTPTAGPFTRILHSLNAIMNACAGGAPPVEMAAVVLGLLHLALRERRGGARLARLGLPLQQRRLLPFRPLLLGALAIVLPPRVQTRPLAPALRLALLSHRSGPRWQRQPRERRW